uniref:FG-GAP repeat protein n=1 Tax=Parascaris equorum TaxID=6256 RepID=A0A914S6B4_PAREQ
LFGDAYGKVEINEIACIISLTISSVPHGCIYSEEWRYNPSLIGDLPIESGKYYGAALFADFDADGLVDIGIPWCADKSCAKVDAIKMWNGRVALWQHFSVTGLEEGGDLILDEFAIKCDGIFAWGEERLIEIIFLIFFPVL